MTCECDILSKEGIFHVALGLCRNLLIHFNILMKTYLYINDAEIASENHFFFIFPLYDAFLRRAKPSTL